VNLAARRAQPPSLMRRRSRRLMPKAAAAPKRGAGPGTEVGVGVARMAYARDSLPPSPVKRELETKVATASINRKPPPESVGAKAKTGP
jgi:hypothetical protein